MNNVFSTALLMILKGTSATPAKSKTIANKFDPNKSAINGGISLRTAPEKPSLKKKNVNAMIADNTTGDDCHLTFVFLSST